MTGCRPDLSGKKRKTRSNRRGMKMKKRAFQNDRPRLRFHTPRSSPFRLSRARYGLKSQKKKKVEGRILRASSKGQSKVRQKTKQDDGPWTGPCRSIHPPPSLSPLCALLLIHFLIFYLYCSFATSKPPSRPSKASACKNKFNIRPSPPARPWPQCAPTAVPQPAPPVPAGRTAAASAQEQEANVEIMAQAPMWI